MKLEDATTKYLEKLLEDSQYSFEGMSSRWDGLQPRRQFRIKISEDFHLGFMFDKIEDNFVKWFYSRYGRSMTDAEYKQFWAICKKQVRRLHEKYDTFYFQE